MKLNKVCLAAINSKYIHSSLSILSLGKMCEVYAESYGIEKPEIVITEKTVNDSFESVAYSILSTNAKIYAFAVYIWNVDFVSKLCKYIKSVDENNIVILGGPEASFMKNHYTFNDNDYNYIVCGEGERCFFALLCEINGISVPGEWNYTED